MLALQRKQANGHGNQKFLCRCFRIPWEQVSFRAESGVNRGRVIPGDWLQKPVLPLAELSTCSPVTLLSTKIRWRIWLACCSDVLNPIAHTQGLALDGGKPRLAQGECTKFFPHFLLGRTHSLRMFCQNTNDLRNSWAWLRSAVRFGDEICLLSPAVESWHFVTFPTESCLLLAARHPFVVAVGWHWNQ